MQTLLALAQGCAGLDSFQCSATVVSQGLERPQVVATSRHVTCGGPELRDVSWKDDVLSGASELVGGDPYEIYLNEPAAFQFVEADAGGARVTGQAADGTTRVIRLESERGGMVRWKVQYRAQP